MGSSGGSVTVGPSIIQLEAPILPLISVGFPYTVNLTWASAFPNAQYSYHVNQDDINGKATMSLLNQSPTGMSFQVTAGVTVAVGARLFVLAWS